MKRLAISAGAVLLLAAAGVCAAADSPMEQCTQQWLDLRAAGKTGGLVYRLFLVQCLKTAPAVPAPKPRLSKASAAKSSVAKPKRPNRMQVCAAQWRDKKANNTTNGMTYRQWSSECLRSH